MYYKKKASIIFRDYGTFGYITDNRNFEYKQFNDYENVIGDKVVSKSGAVFLSALDKKPQNIHEITIKISKIFPNVDMNILKNDIIDFYNLLEKDGFIVSGITIQECNKKDVLFSYEQFQNKAFVSNNYFENIQSKPSTEEFFEKYFKGKPQLTNLHIEITSKCNERCVHCYIPHENKIGEISPYLFYDILEQCKKMRVLHITISGGEPMMHKNFCDFLKKCKEYDFSISILSNLTILTDEIVNEIKANPLTGVQVSLYSMDPKIHDEITTVKGSFERTKRGILKLIENDIPLKISCPILKQNKNCYEDVITWAEKHKIIVGADYEIIAKYDHTTQNLKNRLSINEIDKLITEKIKYEPNYLLKLKEMVEINKKKSPDDYVCSICNSSICIEDSGNVYPCSCWNNYIVGNVQQTPLQEIWEKSERIQYLRSLRKKDFIKCINCSENDYCTMCMVRNANENKDGNPLIVNEFFCDIAKLNKKLLLDFKNHS